MIREWILAWAIALTLTAIVLAAAGWWVTGDVWYVFSALAHSYHAGRK